MPQYEIAPLLILPAGRPPKRPLILYDDFWYRAESWDRARRVVAKVECHRGELFPADSQYGECRVICLESHTPNLVFFLSISSERLSWRTQ